jgi:hypothetical protein
VSIETRRPKVSFSVVLDNGRGVGKEQIPSALGAQKIALRVAINERRQDPPQKKNYDEGQDL